MTEFMLFSGPTDEWKRLDRKAITTIRQWLDDVVFHHVSNESTAQPLSMEKNYKGTHRNKTDSIGLII